VRTDWTVELGPGRETDECKRSFTQAVSELFTALFRQIFVPSAEITFAKDAVDGIRCKHLAQMSVVNRRGDGAQDKGDPVTAIGPAFPSDTRSRALT
jgi:hypothetical protein